MYTNIKSFDGKITTYFKNNSGKEKTLNNIDSHCICLLKIVLDSVYKMKMMMMMMMINVTHRFIKDQTRLIKEKLAIPYNHDKNDESDD